MRISRPLGRTVITLVAALMAVISVGLIGYHQGFTSIKITQSLENERIFVKGSNARPEAAEVTLSLEAPGQAERLVADVMLVIDRSASFPIEKAVDNAKRIIDDLGPEDRVGLVSFGTDATLDAVLTPTNDTQSVKDALADLVADGKTALGDGMAVATDELVFRGRANVEWIEILLTDGRTNSGRDPLREAEDAADEHVVIYSVGVGSSVNRDLLTKIAETTGGKFFSTYSDSVMDEILQVEVSQRDAVVKNIIITETLTKNLKYEETLSNNNSSGNTSEAKPEVIYNSDGTTTLRWRVDELFKNELWSTTYTVSAREVGTYRLHQYPSHVTYEDFRGRNFDTDLPDLRLDVRPTPPALDAKFAIDPAEPTSFDTVQFTDKSTLESGEIVSRLWDFGDGSTSTEENPAHRYGTDGTYRAQLTTKSDAGAESVFSKDIIVFTPNISGRRTINTYIPVDETIPGQTFQVTLEVRVNADSNGLGVQETLPTTWELTQVDNSSAKFNSTTKQWQFSEKLSKGTLKTIIYNVKLPTGTAAGTTSIAGQITSASPSTKEPIRGDTQVIVLAGFSIEVVTAHWDVSATASITDPSAPLNLQKFPEHTISAEQLDQARQWWISGNPVPSTNNLKIDLDMLNRLTAYYLTQTSVFKPLPAPK